VLDCLERVPPGRNGEIQLTDAIAQLCELESVDAFAFAGLRFDCGSKLGYLAATLHYAVRHPEVGEAFVQMLAAAAGQDAQRDARVIGRHGGGVAARPMRSADG
jgi:UTP--glucose-1-phosphate uridylyltransferase